MNPLLWDEQWYAWRLDAEVYGGTWDSGMGSNLNGGRWNKPGRRVVYASVDPSSAILEVAAHHSLMRWTVNLMSSRVLRSSAKQK